MDKEYISEIIHQLISQKTGVEPAKGTQIAKKMKDIIIEPETPSNVLLEKLFGKSNASHFWKTLLTLDKQTVQYLNAQCPELYGMFSRLKSQKFSFETLCQRYIEEDFKQSGHLVCEPAVKGEHTILELIPLLHSYLCGDPTRSITIINKASSVETLVLAFAILIRLKEEEIHSFDSISKSIEKWTEDWDRQLVFSKPDLDWACEHINIVSFNKCSKDIQTIAGLHPTSIVHVEHGDFKEAFCFNSASPIKYDPDDEILVRKRFATIISQAKNPESAVFKKHKISFKKDPIRVGLSGYMTVKKK